MDTRHLVNQREVADNSQWLNQKFINSLLSNCVSKAAQKENQIDQLVYQLYELSDEEIKIVENA